MVNVNKLRGIMAEQGVTGKMLANHLNISANTFSAKMKVGIFNSDEIEKIIVFLHIKNPIPVFFANAVTQKVTNMNEGNSPQGDQRSSA